VAELGIDVVTDARGRFYFHGLPAGQYTILAVDDKFDRFERKLDVKKDESVEVRLYLRPKGGNPYETVVEGEREVLEVTRRTLQRRQLTTVPGTFGDPIRVIQTLPGLARTPFATGFLLIRGSNPDDSGVFIDGHRVPLLFHFLGGPSVLNAEFLEKVNLYPGGVPARYGRAIGGIVSVDTRHSKSDGFHGSADVDLLDSSAYVRFPVTDNSSLALAGRRSYLDLMLGFFLPEPDEGDRLVVVPVYSDYQARYDHDFGRQGKASLFYIRSSDVLDVLSENADAESEFSLNSTTRFWRLIGKYERPIAGGLRLTLTPAVGVDRVGISGSPGEGEAATFGVEVVNETASYRMKVDGNLGEHVYVSGGIDLESRNTRYEILAPLQTDVSTEDNVNLDPDLLVRNVDAFLYALYADVSVTLGKLKVIPGLRLDGYLLNGSARKSVDPRIVARYQLTAKWLVKGYAGLFHQPPQPEALDPEFGNPELDLERAIHTGLGAEWKFADRWFADAEVYYIDRRDLVEFTDDFEEDPETGRLEPVFYRNSRIGDTIGLEFLLRREITRTLYGWLSYTLSNTREKEFGDDAYQPTAFDQRHTLNAVTSWRFGRGWELGGRFRLSTGRPETAVVGGTYDADQGSYEQTFGEFRASRRKTFHQLDTRLEKTWTFDTWRVGAYLDIQNLLNIDNVEATQYDYRYRDRAPITSVPFLPTIGVRGTW
jgi:hypothetical protein